VSAGVEEYTEHHWTILSPDRLGFKGKGTISADAEHQAAEMVMAEFFEGHNKKLDALMAAQNWTWSPFW
jgi:hypothetical protein